MKSASVVKGDRYRSAKNSIPDYDFLFEDNLKEKSKKGNFRFFMKLLKYNRKPLFFSSLVYIFMDMPTWVLPLVTAYIVNVVTGSLMAGGGLSSHAIYQLVICFSIILFVLLLNIPTTILRWRIMSKMLHNNSAAIKCSVIRKLQSLSITYSKDLQTGKVQSKFLKDTDGVDTFMRSMVHTIIPAILSAIVATIVTISKNGYIALFFLIVVPINVIITRSFRKTIGKRYRNVRLNHESMSVKLTTMLEMYTVTKSHGLEKREIDQVSHSIGELRDSGVAADKTMAKFGCLMFIVSSLLRISCVLVCAILAINGVMEVGDILLYESMFVSLSSYVLNIANTMPTISSGNEALNSVAEIMSVKDIEVNAGKAKIKAIEGNVSFKNTSYIYPGTTQKVVKDVDLEVKKGECVAFVGASGSGKSTIMNMIIGLLPPTEGQLLIDGKDINEFDLSEYRHHISVVPQTSVLFAGSIKDNITYGLDRFSDEDVERVAELANLNEFVKDLPDGLNTHIGEHGDKLSGGQKQRINIARALIRNPQILILDEATSALDNISEYHVQKAISSSIQGRTTFIVAHRLSTIRNADLIVVMDGGEIVERGTYEELMDKKGKFYQLKALNDLNSKRADEELNA